MTTAQHQGRWRNGKRLVEIVDRWKKLSPPERTTRTLLLATDAARLSRAFVVERTKVDVSIPNLPEPPPELNDDAGDE